ncbi:MAG TPA: hypothetical protein VD931_19815 [Baekduia sp.]|nr:hypothetical protein [Baekduia sp.]
MPEQPTVSLCTIRQVDRETAIAAMRTAAKTVGCAPEELTAQAYRMFRAARAELGAPSHLAVSLLFGGWARAREQAAGDDADGH